MPADRTSSSLFEHSASVPYASVKSKAPKKKSEAGRSRYPSSRKHIPCEFPGCDKISTQKCNYQDHLNTHYGIKPYKCVTDDCDYSSTHRSSLLNHRKSKHQYIPKRQIRRRSSTTATSTESSSDSPKLELDSLLTMPVEDSKTEATLDFSNLYDKQPTTFDDESASKLMPSSAYQYEAPSSAYNFFNPALPYTQLPAGFYNWGSNNSYVPMTSFGKEQFLGNMPYALDGGASYQSVQNNSYFQQPMAPLNFDYSQPRVQDSTALSYASPYASQYGTYY